jgi:hypothetical protein
MYASFLRISRALHLDVFEQPERSSGVGMNIIFSHVAACP